MSEKRLGVYLRDIKKGSFIHLKRSVYRVEGLYTILLDNVSVQMVMLSSLKNYKEIRFLSPFVEFFPLSDVSFTDFPF